MWRWRLSGSQYDIAVVGSGFAGSLIAAIAHRLGRSVVLLEKGKHPRFAIGESSTPLANLWLEDLTTRYDLPALKPLAKWGPWQRTYPRVGCGLKRGFSFYHHTLGETPAADPDRVNQLLVAASPHNEIADTHWYRADFDQLFVREAQNAGVAYFDEVQLHTVSEFDDEVKLDGTRNGEELTIRAKFVVDATGPRGFLHHALGIPEDSLPDLPSTQALYSHFSHVERIGHAQMAHHSQEPPYPVDDAAVHHVFDGGWVWILRFNNGITSAGVAATTELAERLEFSKGAHAWQRLLNLVPVLKNQFAPARQERSFTHVPKLSFRSGAIVGKRWALLPSAAGFVDPLLSTGFALTLLGIARLAEIIERDWTADRFGASLQTYADQTKNELLAAGRLIACLYKSMGNFPLFVSLSLVYFAAVSYSETVRRLGKPHLANSFLLHGHPIFGPQCRSLLDRILQARGPLDANELTGAILRMIEPINVAGLGDPDRHNWYPVKAEDLLRSASKVGATHDEIVQLLDRSGFRTLQSK
jgi:FADH2 O2-dependent halogenase